MYRLARAWQIYFIYEDILVRYVSKVKRHSRVFHSIQLHESKHESQSHTDVARLLFIKRIKLYLQQGTQACNMSQ